ncbi:response regulator [Erysipelotrichaceae bacterium OttesenSCG-928-M19]|nr:response regulator [Erysipelotrichaceae bacterium OttesenSCG-928-M19]
MKNILVIEDEQAINDLIKEMLKAEGYQVDSAYDGLQGMFLFKENKYDLIICDIMMPHMDGYEVVKKIREEDKYINIIMLSALDQEYDELKGFDLGVDDYIAKPFSSRLLIKRVNALFNKQQNNKLKDDLKKIFRE